MAQKCHIASDSAPPSEADEGGRRMHDSLLTLKAPSGIASACLHVCVIKMALGPPRLQRPHAKAPMNDFKSDRGVKLAPHTTIILPLLTDPPSRHGRLWDRLPKILPSYRQKWENGSPSLRVRVTRVTHNMVKTWHVSMPCSSESHICWCPKGRYDKWESSSGIPPAVMELD